MTTAAVTSPPDARLRLAALAGLALAFLLAGPLASAHAAPPPGNPGKAKGCDKKAQGKRCDTADDPDPGTTQPPDSGSGSTSSGSDDASGSAGGTTSPPDSSGASSGA